MPRKVKLMICPKADECNMKKDCKHTDEHIEDEACGDMLNGCMYRVVCVPMEVKSHAKK
jgi:hypothetical protein